LVKSKPPKFMLRVRIPPFLLCNNNKINKIVLIKIKRESSLIG
jgi:hypothetical protein